MVSMLRVLREVVGLGWPRGVGRGILAKPAAFFFGIRDSGLGIRESQIEL